MGNLQQIRMVLGSLRYKSAPNVDFQYKLPLVQNYKLNYEFDRTSDVNLQQLYDDERQASTVFRPAGKFMLIFKNSYAGSTNYPPFENNLYYLNAAEAASAQCLSGTSIPWTGLPQYNEFDFIRTDVNVSGYTQPPGNHLPIPFIAESASTYNWNHYLSYPYRNESNKILQALDFKTSTTLSWNVGNGLPFIIEKTQVNGRDYISFRCPVEHGLKPNEFVSLSINYNGNSLFQVDTLGLQTFNSNKFVFNIVDVGYTGTTFSNGQTGTFKRVILSSNTGDTISKYYVRQHKILTNPVDAVLVKAGFEENIFGIKKKYESSGFTPNRVARVSIKEGAQSYTISFNRDVDLKNLLDNLGRPVTELFFTTHWIGYFGWTTGVLKQGYEFNLQPILSTGQPTTWWNTTNPLSSTNFTTNTWINPSGLTFSYVNSLITGNTLDGDLCEWNDFEQKERVISKLYHKFVFNPTVFPILGQSNVNNQLGYYYQPHHSIRLREYSTYIETAPNNKVEGIPNYAYFSNTLNEFIWRDIYTYGFLDPQTNIGVDYPFLNKAHYPFKNVIFRIIPEGTNYTEQTIIAEPLIDECE